MKDLFGKAILDYQTQNNPKNLITETSISEADEMLVSYLFRDYSEMPTIEQAAIQLCHGHVLDVGCGAGSHSLYLQTKGIQVTAIDHSESAVAACRLRGVKSVYVSELLKFSGQQFDSILLLMNGTGIFGKLANVSTYLNHLKSLLRPGGQILIDSSDLIYMFDSEENDTVRIDRDHYYGELDFLISYKEETEEPFKWLYLDYNTLHTAARSSGLQCQRIAEGDHYDYLARLFV